MCERERERGLSPALEAVRAELRALGPLLAPCGEVCASEKGTRASAAALLSPTHTHLIASSLHPCIRLTCSALSYVALHFLYNLSRGDKKNPGEVVLQDALTIRNKKTKNNNNVISCTKKQHERT